MRIVAVAIITAVVGAFAPAVGASTPPVPASSIGVATGQMLRAGWYEDITGDCGNVKNAYASVFGTVTGGSGQLSYLPGLGLLGATAPASATGFGATFLAGIGAGGALVTGAQVAAVVAVGVTGFCAGLLGAQWITGNSPYSAPTYTGPFFSFNAGIIPCAQISGFSSSWSDGGSMCQRFSSAGYEFKTSYLNQFGETVFSGNNGNQSGLYGGVRVWSGSPGGPFQLIHIPGAGTGDYSYVSEGLRNPPVVVELNCRSASLCPFLPNAGAHTLTVGKHEANEPQYETAPVTGSYMNSGSVPIRLQARSYCQSPAGQTQLFSANGAWSEAGNTTAPAINGELCPAGWLKLTYNLEWAEIPMSARRSCGAAGLAACVDLGGIATLPGNPLVSWVIPTYVQTNPVLRQCYVEGFTNCEATSADGVTTVINNVTNQTTNVIGPAGQGTVTEVLQPIRDAIEAAGPTPTTVPVTTPTTVPVTTPTTVPVTTPTTVPPPTTIPPSTPGAPPAPPVPEGGGGAGWGTCMEDQTADAAIDNNWSFGSVASYIVKWAVAPIICAVYWIVVPPDGWSAEWAMLSDSVGELPAFQAFFGAVGSIAFEDLGCQPLDFRPQVGNLRFGDGAIDFALCDSYPLQLVWFFFIGLGVLGVLYSGVKSITKMTNSFDKK